MNNNNNVCASITKKRRRKIELLEGEIEKKYSSKK
jgi:hypothetical protein